MLLNLATVSETEGSATACTTADFSWEGILQSVIEWIATYGVKLLIGLVVLFILFAVVNSIAKSVRKVMMKKGVEKTIYTVTYSFIRKGLKLLLFL